MARVISYVFKDEKKTLIFSYQKHRNIHEAVAEAEGIDISAYLAMELQLELISDTKAVRNYRDTHFKKLGFSDIKLLPKENKGIGHK
jgi:hypothetical protein